MKLKGTAIPGYRLDPKSGKPVRSQKHLDLSKRLQQKASRKVRVARRRQPK